MEPMTFVWLGALVVFCLLEGATTGLVSLWFAGGALAALIASLLHLSLLWQTILFVAVSCVLLACLRPVAKKLLAKSPQRTNADRAIGSVALVSEEINNLTGRGAVKISGVEWTARGTSDEPIPVGAQVTVLAIEGAKVRVERIKTAASK